MSQKEYSDATLIEDDLLVSHTPTILVVDDDPISLSILTDALQPHYTVRAAYSGETALRAAKVEPVPDLVLLDVSMPDLDGYTVLNQLREDPLTHGIPLILVNEHSSIEDEEKGFELGAADYLTKPINPVTMLARVRTQLGIKAARDGMKRQQLQLEALVAERTQGIAQALAKAEGANLALRKSYFSTLLALSKLADLRDAVIGDHSRRVAAMSRQVASDMGLSANEVQDVFVAALLRDIGKIGFPDELLSKPVSAMNGEELGLYRRHPSVGAEALVKIEPLANIVAMIRHHHEHYDGSGFPDGLSGQDIPLGARIICAVSYYDDLRNGVLTTSPLSKKESYQHLHASSGRRFDPAVLEQLSPILSFEVNSEVIEKQVASINLQEGMVLCQDVMHPDGFLLLSKGTTLTRKVIDQMVSVEKSAKTKLDILILQQQ